MDLSIITINYNTKALTRECIRSVIAYTQGIDIEIILVDNASSEDFGAEDFRQEFPDVKLIMSPDNLGFAGGNNLGIQHATGDFLLLLNSDTYLKDNALLRLFSYMKNHPKAGAASARLVYPDGEKQCVAQRFPSVRYHLIELFRLQKFLDRRTAGKLLLGSFFDHSENVEVDWVWGTCFIFPRKLLGQLPGGKLDDRYFMYFEDVQWCMDIHRLGYEIHFVAEAEVVHLGGKSCAKKNELMEQNARLFFQRNYKPIEVRFIKTLDGWLR